ncbi:MAG: hypothetical protein KAH11_03475 [Rhodospirillales bacterium]|nr:hypothetical protein [Rhodospirillales bacterium]
MATRSPGSDGSAPRRRGPGKSPVETGNEVLRRSLPVSIRHAVQNYRAVAFADPSADAKEFQQQQAACKAALQHVEMLLKLASQVDAGSGGPAAEGSNTAPIVARAEAAVDAFVNPEPTDKNEE